MYKIAKDVADLLLRRVSQALPAWTYYSIEKTSPARPPYKPTLPANLALFPIEIEQQFIVPVYFTEHHTYRLYNVHATWNGAVFHNLRVFKPSIVRAHFVSGFQDTLLLRQWVGKKVETPNSCVAICHDQWSVENYYHWLIDTLPRLLMLRHTHPGMLLLLPQPLPPKALPDYIKLSAAALGFTQYLPIDTRQILRADCIILPEFTAASLTQNPELIRQVQNELVAALCPESLLATRKVYAARSVRGVRRIINESEVDTLLNKFNFEKVYFEELSFWEQIRLMRETSVFLGVHGAAMTNMLFLQEGAKVVELINQDQSALCYFRLASCVRLPYYYTPCVGVNPALGNLSDMKVDIALLHQILKSIF